MLINSASNMTEKNKYRRELNQLFSRTVRESLNEIAYKDYKSLDMPNSKKVNLAAPVFTMGFPKDEIVYGSMCVDDNGKGLYTTGLRHGDAVHVTDMDPSRPGMEVFGIHEIERV